MGLDTFVPMLHPQTLAELRNLDEGDPSAVCTNVSGGKLLEVSVGFPDIQYQKREILVEARRRLRDTWNLVQQQCYFSHSLAGPRRLQPTQRVIFLGQYGRRCHAL